jgi:hypothetical protein
LEAGSKKLAVGFAPSAGAGNPLAATVAQGDTSATETPEEEKKDDPAEDSESDVCHNPTLDADNVGSWIRWSF